MKRCLIILFLFITGWVHAQPPVISSFSPNIGLAGDTISIFGSNLDSIVLVSFGNVSASSFNIVSPTHIKAILSVSGGSGNVIVTDQYDNADTLGVFTFIPPVPQIDSIDPPYSNLDNIPLNIYGVNLIQINSVTFGGVPASYIEHVNTGHLVVIPDSGATGFVKVKNTSGEDSIPGFNFYQRPVISFFTPSSGTVGDTIEIHGNYLSSIQYMQFGGVSPLTIQVLSDTLIRAKLDNSNSGEVTLTTLGGSAAKEGFIFIPPPPGISAFIPNSAIAGGVVNIEGGSFIGATNVSFGGVPAISFIVQSWNLIQAVVGNGASGNVSVTTPAGTGTISGFTFLTAPSITSFSPISASSGQTVVIKGERFSSASAVFFGSVPAASFTVLSDTSISATVAWGASGNIVIQNLYGFDTIPGFTFLSPNRPVVSSFYPAIGEIGTLVTLTGNYFNSIVANNSVYFGPVKAQVISAAPTTLLVKVPAGANYELIAVTNLLTNLSGYSSKPFHVILSDTSNITPASFVKTFESYVYQGSDNYSTIADIDGDGKSDIISSFSGQTMISIFRNTSTNGTLSFAPKIDFATQGFYPTGVNYIDFNGDGKLDVLVSNNQSHTVEIFKNVSTPGIISFSASNYYGTFPYPQNVAVGDLDGDGRPDLVTANDGSSTLYKNISTAGNINVAQNPMELGIGSTTPNSAYIKDLNGDQKPDLVIVNNGLHTLTIYPNNSSPGLISFANRMDFDWGVNAQRAAIGDFNGDGKPDLAITTVDDSLFILKNIGVGNGISFLHAAKYKTSNGEFEITTNDINGDGKLDIILSGKEGSKISILKNNSTSANFNFAAGVDYPVGFAYNPGTIAVGDMDGDNNPDITVASPNNSSVSVFVNQSDVVINLCPNGGTTLYSNLSGISYQWQVDDGSGFTNISDNINYTGTSSNSLQLINIPSSWYSKSYRCVVSGSYSKVFKLKFTNKWTGSINSSWEVPGNWSCGTVPDANSDVYIDSGSVIVNSNITLRSLSIKPGVLFTVNPGFVITLTSGVSASGSLSGSPGSCTPVTINGNFIQSTELNTSNTIQIQVNVTSSGPFIISTNTVNGVKFSKAGNFTTLGIQNLILNGSGTPDFSGNFVFTVTFGNSNCNFNIIFSQATPDYFPMVLNSNWSYDATSTSNPVDSLFKRSLSNFLTFNNKQYREFNEVNEFLNNHNSGYRKNGKDYFFYYNHFDDTHSLIFLEANGEIKQLNDSIPVGGTWSNNITGWVNGGSVNTPIQVHGIILEKGASVTLPTGLSFSNVIKVKLDFYDLSNPSSPAFVYAEERWFALGAGLIYYKSSDPFGIGIIYQAKHYQVY